MKRKDIKNSTESDKELVSGIIKGDVCCFEKLYWRYYPRLLTFVKGMVKDAGKGQDITQDIFMNLWNYRESLDANLSVKNFLFVSARNRIINHFKSRTRTSTVLVPEYPDIAPSRLSTPYDLTEFHLTRDHIMAAVTKMPQRRQAIFRLNKLENMDKEEIAKMMGLSVRTVDKHLELAKKDIKNALN